MTDPEPIDWTQELLDAAAAGRELDARISPVIDGTLTRKSIPAAALLEALDQQLLSGDSAQPNIAIKHAVIEGDLEFPTSKTDWSLVAIDCHFAGALTLDRCHLAALNLSESVVVGRFSLKNAAVSEDVVLDTATFLAGATLTGAAVGRDLIISGAVLVDERTRDDLDLRPDLASDTTLAEMLGEVHRYVSSRRRRLDRPLVLELDRVVVRGRCLLDGLRVFGASVASRGASVGRIDLSGADVSRADALALLDARANGGTSPAGGAAGSDDDEPPTLRDSGGGGSGDGIKGWDWVFQFVGLGAALAAWVAVVGGARVWARLYNYEVPALPTMAGVGRDWMIVEGLQTLVVPVLLGGAVALLIFYWERDENALENTGLEPHASTATDPGFRARISQELELTEAGVGAALALALFGLLLLLAEVNKWGLLALAVVTPIAGLLVLGKWGRGPATVAVGLSLVVGGTTLFYLAVKPQWALFMLAVTGLALWLTVRALPAKTAGATALTIFVAIVGWSGAIGYAQEAGDKHPTADYAKLTVTGGGQLEGRLLGRSGDRLFLGIPFIDESDDDDQSNHRVVVIDNDDIVRLIYSDKELSESEVKEATPTAPTETGPTVSPTTATPSTTTPTPTDPTEDEPTGTDGREEQEDLPDDEALAVREAYLKQNEIQVQVLRLSRAAGFVELDLKLVNLDGETWTIDRAFSNNGEPSLNGLKLFDIEGARMYRVAREGQSCACDMGLDLVRVGQGESRVVSAIFQAPAAATGPFDVKVPGFRWIRNVALE